MRQVRAALFEEWDKRELQLAERWIGVHPQADEASGREIPRRPNETVRQRLLALLHSVTESNEPAFAERLRLLQEALTLIIETAWAQSVEGYWLAAGCTTEQAGVLMDARMDAYTDCSRARAVVDEALSFADAVREMVEEETEGGL